LVQAAHCGFGFLVAKKPGRRFAVNANSGWNKTDSNKTASNKRSKAAWVFLLAVLAALSAVFVWRGAEKAMKMQTAAANGSEFAQAKQQESVKVVVEVFETAEGEIRGRLLERQDDAHYTRTKDEARIHWDTSTAIVMGKTGDVRPGAILHITGTMAVDHSVQARQIVILTGYVQVK
jgi:hypothetical protein